MNPVIDKVVKISIEIVTFQTYKSKNLYSKSTSKFCKGDADPFNLFDLIKENKFVRSEE